MLLEFSLWVPPKLLLELVKLRAAVILIFMKIYEAIRIFTKVCQLDSFLHLKKKTCWESFPFICTIPKCISFSKHRALKNSKKPVFNI